MNELFVLIGPSAVGKTQLALKIAEIIGSPVISADSRQIYKEMIIGTAKPTPKELATVKHYFIGTKSVNDYYSASLYEEDALALVAELHKTHSRLLLCGGSMLYIDAVCKGIDDMPTISTEVRKAVWEQYQNEGINNLLETLKILDPAYYIEVDRQNYRRVIHAVEICKMTGKPYSYFRTHTIKQRPFRIIKIGLDRERSELYNKINSRVDKMIEEGLIEEAVSLYPFRHYNALNTVGYKELFGFIEDLYPLEDAIEKIKRNTRVYARKQLTWFRRDNSIKWFHPDNEDDIFTYIKSSRIVN